MMHDSKCGCPDCYSRNCENFAPQDKPETEIERLQREIADLCWSVGHYKARWNAALNLFGMTEKELKASEAKLAAAEAALVSSKAETIARAAHAGQKDTLNGNDYILHVERVVARVDGEETKAVAWLHDVLEDTSITACGLRAAGIPESVVFSVLVLTKQEGAIYENYIRRILAVGDQSALGVKRADIEDHLHANCPERLRTRYEKAMQMLVIDAAKTEVRPCTCHPSEAPVPCQHKYALTNCKKAARGDKT